MTKQYDDTDVSAGRPVNWVSRVLVTSMILGTAAFVVLAVL